MSIKHANNTMRVQCDLCDRKEEIYFGHWSRAWTDARTDGWRAWKDKSDAWCHSCPTCAKENAPA